MLAISIYALLGSIIASAEAFRFARRGSIDALTFFNFFYFLFFVFAPINVILFGEVAVRQKHAYHTFGSGDEITALCLLLCYVLFLMGYLARPAVGTGSSPLKMRPGETYSLRQAARIAVVFFAIGAIAISYHVAQVGGLLEVIREAANIRSGELGFESRYVFLRQFNAFLSCAFVLYLTVYLGKKTAGTRVTVADKAALMVTGIAFIYYALSTAGRREFLYPVLLYVLVSLSAGRRFGWKTLTAVVLLFILGLAWIPLAMSALLGIDAVMSYEVLEIAYLNTVQGIADTYIHFVGMQHADLWQFGFLSDIVELPLQLVPSRLLDFDRGRGMFGETSRFFLGEDLAANLSGEEPPGLHGYLLVNFGYFGMFLLFFVWGVAYRWLHNMFRPTERADALAWLIYWWVFCGFLVLFREGVLALVVKQHASWWLAIVLLMLTRRRPIRLGASRVPGRSATPQG